MALEVFQTPGSRTIGIDQVANLCCVSIEKAKAWMEKGLLKSVQGRDTYQTKCEDLIDFLMQYNMSIPDSILPIKAKKILFIFSEETLGYIYVSFLANFFEKLKKEENFISDHIAYGDETKYKIFTFMPELIIADTIGAFDQSIDLIEFVKKIGGIKLLLIVKKEKRNKDLHMAKYAGADGVIERSVDLKSLISAIRNIL